VAYNHEVNIDNEILGTLYVVSAGKPTPDSGTAASLSQAAFQAGRLVEATKTRQDLYERTVRRRTKEQGNDEFYTDRKIGYIDLNGVDGLSARPSQDVG